MSNWHTPDDGCEPPPYEGDDLYSGWTEHEAEVDEYEHILDGHLDGTLPNADTRVFSCGMTVPLVQSDADSEALEMAGFCPACGEQGGHEGDESEIVSVSGVNPRCDICGEVQQPDDDWNGDTGNHRDCEIEHERDGAAEAAAS